MSCEIDKSPQLPRSQTMHGQLRWSSSHLPQRTAAISLGGT